MENVCPMCDKKSDNIKWSEELHSDACDECIAEAENEAAEQRDAERKMFKEVPVEEL